jgi:hypothetical protein
MSYKHLARKRLIILVMKPGINAAVKTLRNLADEIESNPYLVDDNWIDGDSEGMWIEEGSLSDLFDTIMEERKNNP